LIRGVIFDLDGTLIALRADGSAFRREASAELRRIGFRVDDVSHVSGRNYVQDLLDRARAQIEDGAVSASFDEVRARTYRALDALEMKWIEGSHPLPGVMETLSALRSRGPPLRLAILTNSGRPATSYAMTKFGFGRYIDRSFTRDDLPVMKPRPEGVEAALRSLSLERDEALFVGDSRVDILASRSAGVRVVSVPTGGHDIETLKRDSPDYILGSMLELGSLVSSLR
ncbi:MAG: HAD family hydrolase, partial [Nitrososphaerota archaeon]|jgi:HAD superfamily hydrolase (TIGR01509 family)|nr:HAD family hydrolase [Nitrososphaerota archaeon]